MDAESAHTEARPEEVTIPVTYPNTRDIQEPPPYP
jgi:hypothetical protein